MYYGTPPIVTNGLVLNLDAQSPQSIPLDPTVNLVTINPTPINNLTGYDYAYGAPTASYNAVSQSIEIETLNSPVGWIVNNTSLNSTVLDTGSLYTISFEWKPESDSTSLCRIWPQIVTGNNLTSSYSGVMRNSGSSAVTSQNTLLPNGWYLFSQTFTPSHPGVNGNRSFRLLGGGVGGGEKLHIHWRKLQLERTPYRTPFVSGSYQAWYDLSGNNNTATLLSSSISGGIPVFPAANNRVLQFDGTGSYAQTTTILTSSTYTAEFFFNATSLRSGVEKWLGSQYNFGANRTIFDISTDNRLRNFMGNGTNPSSTFIFSTTVVQPNRWYHAVFSKDTFGTGSLYINGVLEGSGAMSLGIPQNTPFQIGGSTSLPVWFNGRIPITRLYNRALSQAEITQNYNALKSRFGLQ